MKYAPGDNESAEEARADMRDAHRLLRKGTDAILAFAPTGFPGRISWCGYVCVAEDVMPEVHAVNFVPTLPGKERWREPLSWLTVELRLQDATRLTVDEEGEGGTLALHWQTPFGEMHLALIEATPEPE